MAVCERCGKEHDGSYGSGRFCGYSCANVRIHSRETKQKISKGVKLNNKTKGIISKRDLGKLYNYKTPEEFPNLNIKIHICKICGKQFYHVYDRDTCDNPQCRKVNNSRVQLKHWQESPRDKYRTDNHWNSLAKESKYLYYYTYKITNLVNGKYYLGMHMTNNLNDGYMGSGRAIKLAIKKYGLENFSKTILQYFSCYADMADAETKLITDEVISDSNSYNAKCGGCGGPAFTGHRHTQEAKKIMSQKAKDWYQTHKNKYNIIAD